MKPARYIFFIVLLGLLSGLIGCAGQFGTQPLVSFTDPDFKGKIFSKIMVITPFKNLSYRTQAEKILAARFDNTSVKCAPSMDLIYPTRTYKDEDVIELLKKNNYDGLLQIAITGSTTEQRYIPPSALTIESGNKEGNSIGITTGTDIIGGYYDSRTFIRLEVKLIDVATGKIAWIAGTETTAVTLNFFDKAVGYLADEIIKKLQTDGFLTVPGSGKE